MEEFKLAIVNFQAYLDFDEETDLEEDLEKQIKIATTEEDKYSFIEEIAGIKFDDWTNILYQLTLKIWTSKECLQNLIMELK